MQIEPYNQAYGYNYWLAQNAFRSYNPYYSAEERRLQLRYLD